MRFWKSYPRIVGETGGKNFHLLHPTADVKNAALKSVRAAFEYQGQKCSALSRVYVPASIAEEFKSIVVSETEKLSMGAKFTDFCGPVISRSAYDRVSKYIIDAKEASEIRVLAGGQCDDSVGYFIRPTVIETSNPDTKFMREETFGPFMCIYVYQDADFGSKIYELIDSATEYALSGAFFAKDRTAIIEATEELRFSAGNFYIKFVFLRTSLIKATYLLTIFAATNAQVLCLANSRSAAHAPVGRTIKLAQPVYLLGLCHRGLSRKDSALLTVFCTHQTMSRRSKYIHFDVYRAAHIALNNNTI